MEKVFKQKHFNNFVWAPLGSRVNIYINFCLQVPLRCLQPDIVADSNLPPALLTPAANLPPVSTTRAELVAKFAAGVVDTGGKFATGVVDTNRRQFATGVIDTGGKFLWYTLTCEYLSEFSKKFEMTLMLFSGAWGKVIHEKKPEAKNLVTLSL
jgi:hypothetical protein